MQIIGPFGPPRTGITGRSLAFRCSPAPLESLRNPVIRPMPALSETNSHIHGYSGRFLRPSRRGQGTLRAPLLRVEAMLESRCSTRSATRRRTCTSTTAYGRQAEAKRSTTLRAQGRAILFVGSCLRMSSISSGFDGCAPPAPIHNFIRLDFCAATPSAILARTPQFPAQRPSDKQQYPAPESSRSAPE